MPMRLLFNYFLVGMRLLPRSSSATYRVLAGIFLLVFTESALGQGQEVHRTTDYGTTDHRPALLPAKEAFERWLEQRRAAGQAGLDDAQELATGVQLAQTRAREMRA